MNWLLKTLVELAILVAIPFAIIYFYGTKWIKWTVAALALFMNPSSLEDVQHPNNLSLALTVKVDTIVKRVLTKSQVSLITSLFVATTSMVANPPASPLFSSLFITLSSALAFPAIILEGMTQFILGERHLAAMVTGKAKRLYPVVAAATVQRVMGVLAAIWASHTPRPIAWLTSVLVPLLIVFGMVMCFSVTFDNSQWDDAGGNAGGGNSGGGTGNN